MTVSVMTLSDFVKVRRGQLGLSIRDVATKAAMSPAGVHDIESGNAKDFYASSMLGLSKALKVKPAVVFEAAINSLTKRASSAEAAPASAGESDVRPD